jgi:N-methylhydantoinase A
VRDYWLVAFGGSGPLQAGKLVDILGLQGALIPPSPGNVSAFGLLTVDVKTDFVTTAVERDDQLNLERVNACFVGLEDEARQALAAEGFLSGAADAARLVRSADMRYFGQAWEVRVEVPAGPFDRAAADATVQRFHAAHQRMYGYSYASSPEQRIEWVNVRVMGIGALRRPALQRRPSSLPGGHERACTSMRQVFFDDVFASTPVYARAKLQAGDCINGPAIVEEFGSTTVVYPELRAQVDDYANLLLERRA